MCGYEVKVRYIMNTYIGNLSRETLLSEFRYCLEVFGKMAVTAISTYRVDGNSRGLAFVEMSMVAWIIFGGIPGFLACTLAAVFGRFALRRILPCDERCIRDFDGQTAMTSVSSQREYYSRLRFRD